MKFQDKQFVLLALSLSIGISLSQLDLWIPRRTIRRISGNTHS